MPKKQHVVNHDGYKTVWFNGDRRDRVVNVDVFKGDLLVLQWTFPQVAGTSLIGNAAVFLEQAIIYAKNPPDAIPGDNLPERSST